MAVTGEHRPVAFAAACKDALISALLALGLAVPILALRTEQNMLNELVLQPRWGYVAFAVLATFVLRLAYLMAAPLASRHAPRPLARIAAPRGASRVFAGVLAPLRDRGVDCKVKVGPHGSHGSIATVVIAGVPQETREAVGGEVQALLAPYVMRHEVEWA